MPFRSTRNLLARLQAEQALQKQADAMRPLVLLEHLKENQEVRAVEKAIMAVEEAREDFLAAQEELLRLSEEQSRSSQSDAEAALRAMQQRNFQYADLSQPFAEA